MLEFKKDKDTDYVLSWKSKGVYNSKLKTLCTAWCHQYSKEIAIKESMCIVAME